MKIFYPGEMEARNDLVHRREGLQLADDTLADLRRIAGECGLARCCRSSPAPLAATTPNAPRASRRLR